MSTPCQQIERIDRLHAELYTGTEGRQPVTVRLASVERVANTLAYVSTALLLATIVGAASVLYKTVSTANELKATVSRIASSVPAAPQYEPAGRN